MIRLGSYNDCFAPGPKILPSYVTEYYNKSGEFLMP